MMKTMPPSCAFLFLLLTTTSSAERSLHIKRDGATIPTTPVSATAESDCFDSIDNCHQYGVQLCTGAYAGWALAHCQKYCGFCGATIPATPVSTTCSDSIDNCHQYGVELCTGKYVGWAVAHCRKYCGLCGDTEQTTGIPIGRKRDIYRATIPTTPVSATRESDCFDARPDCDEHGEIMMCTAHIVWAWDNCQKYCGFCALCASLCQNGGTCDTPNSCICPPDYTGISCEIPICASPCQNGGTCDAPNHCDCAPGYTGRQCETKMS